MNGFDYAIIKFLNGFSRHSWVFDQIICGISSNNLLKGGVLVSVIWWILVAEDKSSNSKQVRGHIISTMIACFVALAVARGVALVAPFRLRPIHDKTLDFISPYGIPEVILDGWSSFPSDHAALFFSLSTGVIFISRRAGIFALLYTALVIAAPRLYLGLHFPTDIIVGAIIGAGISVLLNIFLSSCRFLQVMVSWSYSKENVFYSVLFLINFEIAELFESVRHVAHGLVTTLLHFT